MFNRKIKSGQDLNHHPYCMCARIRIVRRLLISGFPEDTGTIFDLTAQPVNRTFIRNADAEFCDDL